MNTEFPFWRSTINFEDDWLIKYKLVITSQNNDVIHDVIQQQPACHNSLPNKCVPVVNNSIGSFQIYCENFSCLYTLWNLHGIINLLSKRPRIQFLDTLPYDIRPLVYYGRAERKSQWAAILKWCCTVYTVYLHCTVRNNLILLIYLIFIWNFKLEVLQ